MQTSMQAGSGSQEFAPKINRFFLWSCRKIFWNPWPTKAYQTNVPTAEVSIDLEYYYPVAINQTNYELKYGMTFND